MIGGGPGNSLAGILRLLRLTLGTVAITIPLGLLSLGLAVVIWVLVTTEENPSVRRAIPIEIPVELVNIPRGLLPSDIVPERVTVTVSGPRRTVEDVRSEEVVARVDLARAEDELGSSRQAIVERPVRADVRRRGVRGEVSPGTIRVRLERQERRTVPVCVDAVDVTPPGFTLEGPPSAEPAEVDVVGTRESIEAVECAAARVRLSGLTVSVTSAVPLEPRDSGGRLRGGVEVEPGTAAVSVRIRQNFYARQAVIDPRISGRPAAGFAVTSIRVNPNVAGIIGPLDAVNALTSVPTEVIDIEGARADVVRAVAIQVPAGVSSSEQRTVVTVTIQAARGPGAIGVVPRVVNLAPNLSATVSVPTVLLAVTGPLNDLAQLKPGDVTVTLDASGFGPGVHALEPKATLPPSLAVESITPASVEVTITAGAPATPASPTPTPPAPTASPVPPSPTSTPTPAPAPLQPP